MPRQLINTKGMPREEWLELRRHSIGGSDAGGVVGMSAWSSPVRVYANKKGLVKDAETNEAMRLGTDLEGYVAQRFTEETGKKVRNDSWMYMHDEYDFITANIDRRIVGENAGLECKTANPFGGTDYAAGEVPEQYYCQCQHYMAVMGFDRMYLAVLVYQKGVFINTIERDQTFIDQMIAEEVRFWNEHMIPDEMPMADDSVATADTIKEMYPDAIAGKEVKVQGLDAICNRIDEIKELLNQLDDEKDELENRLKLALKDAEMCQSDKWKVTYKNRNSSRIDSKRLQEELPSVAAKYSKPVKYRVLSKRRK